MDNRPVIILFAVLVAVIFVGQILAYAPIYHSNATVWRNEDGSISYSIDTNTSSQYAVVLLNNNDIYDIDRLLIYYDPEYAAHHTSEYLKDKIDLLISELELRNSPSVMVMDANETKEVLTSEISSDTYKTALIMMSGVCPDTIYDGTADSLIIKWLEGGGVLYWIGDTIGLYVGDRGEEDLIRHQGYGEIFFGANDEVVAIGEIRYADKRSPNADISSSLNIYYNIVTFGVDVSYLDQYISIGYRSNGFDSIVLTKFHSGNGMIVVFGGDASSDAAPIMAQVICSKINYSTSLIAYESGIIKRDTITGRIFDLSDSTHIYIFLGVPLVTYAKLFDLMKV